MSDIFDVLSSSESEDKTIRCQSCGHLCPEDMDICEECGEAVQLITMADQGLRLPIGIVKDERDQSGKVVQTLYKDFDLVKTDFAIERKVSDTWGLIQKRRNYSPLEYITNLLSHTVVTLANQEFQKINHDKRMYVLSQMYLGDVFYMYAYLRYLSIGPEFAILNVACPVCMKKIEKFSVDLSSLEIMTIDTIDDLYHWVELEEGLIIDNAPSKEFLLSPLPFSAMVRTVTDNRTSTLVEFIKSCVVEIKGVPKGRFLTEQDLFNPPMCARDISICSESIDYYTCGPRWTIDVVCPNCHETFVHFIDWDHASFFRVSSPSKKRRRRSRTW